MSNIRLNMQKSMVSKKEDKSAGQELEEKLLMKPKVLGETDNGLLGEAMERNTRSSSNIRQSARSWIIRSL